MSREHVIPNAIGGKLKSNVILCKSCNSRLGNSIDGVLAKNLGKYMTMFAFNRERGKNQSIELFDAINNDKYKLFDNRLEMIKPYVEEIKNDSDVKIEIIARSDKEASKIVKGFQKKYNLTDDEIKTSFKTKKRKFERLNKIVSISLEFGGIDFYRAIGKIALCYYSITNDDFDGLNDIVGYVNGDCIPEKNIVTMYYSEDNMSQWNNDAIFHYIGIKKHDDWIIGYIELFKVFKFVVKIKKVDNKKNINEARYYEWLTDEKYLENELDPYLNNIDNIFSKEIFDYLDEFTIEINGLMAIAYKTMEQREVNRSISRIIKDVGDNHSKSEYFTDEMITEITNRAVKEFIDIKYRKEK